MTTLSGRVWPSTNPSAMHAGQSRRCPRAAGCRPSVCLRTVGLCCSRLQVQAARLNKSQDHISCERYLFFERWVKGLCCYAAASHLRQFIQSGSEKQGIPPVGMISCSRPGSNHAHMHRPYPCRRGEWTSSAGRKGKDWFAVDTCFFDAIYLSLICCCGHAAKRVHFS